MKKFLAWLKSMRWLAWVVIAAIFAVLVLVLRSLFAGPKHTGPNYLPPVPAKLQEKVDKVEEAALKARVEATVVAAADKKEIDEIAKIPDGKERRKRLAEKLRRL